MRRGLWVTAALFVLAGLVWVVGFPKKAALDTDMVLSVALGVALVSTGALLALARRWGAVLTVLALVATWSLLGNAVLVTNARNLEAVNAILIEGELREDRLLLEKLESGEAQQVDEAAEELRRRIRAAEALALAGGRGSR